MKPLSKLSSDTIQTQFSEFCDEQASHTRGGFRTCRMKLDMSERRGHGSAACFRSPSLAITKSQSHVAEGKPLTTLRPISRKFANLVRFYWWVSFPRSLKICAAMRTGLARARSLTYYLPLLTQSAFSFVLVPFH
jgi:hypothetical protein